MIAKENRAVLTDVDFVARDGAMLRAWSIRPTGWNGDTVILLHGQGDNRSGMLGPAAILLRHGFATLLPDARAHGSSGGSIATYGVLEADDVRRWFEWIQKAESPHCIDGLGDSMGSRTPSFTRCRTRFLCGDRGEFVRDVSRGCIRPPWAGLLHRLLAGSNAASSRACNGNGIRAIPLRRRLGAGESGKRGCCIWSAGVSDTRSRGYQSAATSLGDHQGAQPSSRALGTGGCRPLRRFNGRAG